jgi:hypothetical protein
MLAVAPFIIHHASWQGQDVLGPSFVRVADNLPEARGKRDAVFGGLTPNEHILRYPILAFYFIAAAVRSLSINTRFRSIPHLYPPSAPVPRMTR